MHGEEIDYLGSDLFHIILKCSNNSAIYALDCKQTNTETERSVLSKINRTSGSMYRMKTSWNTAIVLLYILTLWKCSSFCQLSTGLTFASVPSLTGQCYILLAFLGITHIIHHKRITYL